MNEDSAREDIALRLKEARAKLFPTAADAARALDMKPVTVRAHESGQNGVNYADLERYARRYGVDIAWLLTGKGPSAPSPERHVQFGELVPIVCNLQDGAWLESEDEEFWTGWGERTGPDGLVERVVFTDPRFPAHLVNALRVVSARETGEYSNGTIVFIYPHDEIGYRDGDDVVIMRIRGDFTEWTLRRVRRVDENVTNYLALTSDDAPINDLDFNYDFNVVGVVVGYLKRLNVNLPTLATHRAREDAERRWREAKSRGKGRLSALLDTSDDSAS